MEEAQDKKKGMRSWVQLLILAVVVLLIVILALGLNNSSNRLNEGDKISYFQLEDINKEIFDLADYKGKVIVLNFFATWCQPCVEEVDELEAFQKSIQESGKAEFLIVDVGELQSTVQPFIDKYQSTSMYVFDKKREVMKDFGVTGQPETLIIDKNGVLQKRIIGPTTARNLEILVDQYQ